MDREMDQLIIRRRVINLYRVINTYPLPENLDLSARRNVNECQDLAQSLLVTCWRIAKSVSSLMGSLCFNFDANFETFKKCGEFFLGQLTRGRHRGAFELAAAGFTSLCKHARTQTNPQIKELPDKWLEETFDLLRDEGKNRSFCNTRRSAGLPFLFSAICCADVGQRGKPLLHSSIKTLFPLAENVDHADRSCHARNALRKQFLLIQKTESGAQQTIFENWS